MKKIRVCHYPQIPCKPFIVEVPDEKTAKLIVDTLANQHLFLYENRFIPDYSNAILVQVWHYEENEWQDFIDEETGMEWDEYAEEFLTL